MDELVSRKPLTRFAAVEEVMSEEFLDLVRVLDKITVAYQLPDHSDVNRQRYPWSLPLLSSPALYAARMWEYPFALQSAELEPRMKCADIGCGMTAFTVYLKEVARCEVVGVDPDVFDAGIRYKGHGVSREFVEKSGLQIVQCGMEWIALSSNTFDRVFCLSVVEHLPEEAARSGLREMARILKPGGRIIITIDTNMRSEISRPFDLLAFLIWDCGMLPLGEMDLRWPRRRFGMFNDGKQPADVFGMTLTKDDYEVETQYSDSSGTPTAAASYLPVLRSLPVADEASPGGSRRPLWRRIAGRFKRALLVLLRG